MTQRCRLCNNAPAASRARAARLPPRPLRCLSSEKTYAVPGRVLQDIPKARPEKGWPWYLKAIGASAACAGTGAYVALLMHHELGFRRFCESVSPSLVDLVRQRYPFADEDPGTAGLCPKIDRGARDT